MSNINMQCADEGLVVREFYPVFDENGKIVDHVCTHCGWAQVSTAAGAAELCNNANWTNAESFEQYAAIAREGGFDVRENPVANTVCIKVVVLCRNSEGLPEFHTCQINATPSQIEQGEHLSLAEENAEYNGYEKAIAVFDQHDPAAKQMAAISDWLK